jgi:hypothetical protein
MYLAHSFADLEGSQCTFGAQRRSGQQGCESCRPVVLPERRVGWKHDAYSHTWAKQAAQLLQTRTVSGRRVEAPSEHSVYEYKDLPLSVFQGWRGLAEGSGE